ncbi:MAG TPA: anti-sigma factor RsbA family regulatory protein [Mycobacterium sp.]|nr:anti-sigma factor RsbA family regulatory protein [Mycobacterium sp.]
MPATQAQPQGNLHVGLFYRSEQQYVDEVLPFIAEGRAAGEPTLVVVPDANLALLRDALGDVFTEVTAADATEAARNPGRLLGIETAFIASHAGRRVRMVAEVLWPGRTADEYPACLQHEVLVNAALQGQQVTGLCPFDASRLDERMLGDVRMAHPWIRAHGSTQRCDEYAPDDALARCEGSLPSSAAAATHTVTALTELTAARAFAARYARRLGLSPDRVEDLKIIVTELATNSLMHARAVCRLAFWAHDGQLICQASDSGRLDDPLAGRRAPAEDVESGRGLFVVNALADLVRIHPAVGGTTIRAYLRLDTPSAVAL